MPHGNENRSITAGDNEFHIGDETASLYGGAVHYWRLDRDDWGAVLDRMKEAGFTMVSIYIPWEAHEIERGKFDFGETNPSNDLGAFITMCEERGLYVVARLGPQINGEMTWFGYPRRILEDERLHAKSAQGSKAVLTQVPKPIPALSYAAEEFFEETAFWYDALCEILAKHAYPNGGHVIAAQVDNEMVYFFHLNAYACDFSDAAIRKYREFLEKKYENIEALGEAYGGKHGSFAEVEPPRRFEGKSKEDIPYYADWAEYRERYLVEALGRLAGMLKERGLGGIPLFHNYPHPLGAAALDSAFMTPQNIPALEEALDFVGFDIYFRKEMYDYIKTVVSYVAGSSRYPYVPELFTGTWPWFIDPGDANDEEFVAKAALMHGIKGFSRYVLVERDRWMASPIRGDGRVREDKHDMFRRVNEMAERHRFADLRRQTDVLLLGNREYDRLESAGVLVSYPGDFLDTPTSFPGYPSSMTVSEGTLGFEEPVQLAKSEWFVGYYHALTDAGYGFLISDTALPPERWRARDAIALASFEYMDASLQRAIVEYAEEGGLLLLGPRIPHLDERMRPDETLRSALSKGKRESLIVDGAEAGAVYGVGEGRISHLSDLTRLDRAMEAALRGRGLSRISKKDPRLEVTVHRDMGDEGRFVAFVANPTDAPLDAEVDLRVELESVTDIWNQRPVKTNGGSFREELPPYTINIYECEKR